MFEQLILHAVGDYALQTEKMAKEKTSGNLWAFIHCITYTLPFILVTQSVLALMVIFGTHFAIDRFRLARYVIFYKNKITDWDLKWEDCKGTGFHKDTPPWMAVWLMIIIDNTLHVVINYLSISYL